MKHFFRSTLFLLLLAFPLLAACSDDHADDVPQPGSVKGRRTVILYMAAENNLGTDGYLRTDSTEVMKGRIWLANEDRLLMFIDDEKGSRLYRVTKQNNTPTLVHRWNRKLNAADSETLREVCQMTKEQFPAEEYGLVCWSHATGWIPPTPASTQNVPLKSFGLDRGNEAAGNSEMLIEDFAEAIEASGMHFTYIFFDCCLMQTIETAYALRHVTERVIAAPMSIAACGADYESQIRNGLFAKEPAEIAKTYVADAYDPAKRNTYGDWGIAISCLRTDGLEKLAHTIRELLPQSQLVNKTSPDMNGVLFYQYYGYKQKYRPHAFDMAATLRRLLPEEAAQEAVDVLDECLEYYGSGDAIFVGNASFSGFYVTMPEDRDRFRAVSMFVPQTIYEENANVCPYGNLNLAFQQTEWYRAAGFDRTGW